jgi:regulator of chromosome condensation
VARAGDVYVFGRGDSSQLGLGDKCDLHAAPQLLKSVSGKGVIKVCCGSNQCAAVTDTGDLYTWGFGEMYQLCNGKMQDNVTPQLITAEPLGGLRVLDAGMGGQHTVVLAAKADD